MSRGGVAACAALACVAILAACEHAQPFGGFAGEPNGPRNAALPTQLTFDSLPDGDAAWMPDGSRMIYAFDPYKADHDRCLATLPPFGGHQTEIICHVPPGAFDAESTNVLSNPAGGADDRIAYLRESSPVGSVLPGSRELVVATLAAPDPGRVVLAFPHLAPDGQLYATVSNLHWVNDTELVFLAELTTYPGGNGVAFDTVLTPIEVARLVLTGDSGVVVPVPGTLGATSATASSSGAIYYTMANDSTVYAADPAGGAGAPVFVFDTLGPVTAVQVAGSRWLLVLACCQVIARRAGQLYLGDVTTDSVRAVTTWPYVYYQRPALDPSGSYVIAEQHPVTMVGHGEGGPVDTLVSKNADLWLIRAH